ERGFAHFRGTVISGGTESGVAAVAGSLAQPRGEIRAVGYLPATTPPGTRIDRRYTHHRRTSGDGFSILEPIAYWEDLFGSGFKPGDVSLIGFHGGRLAACEYRMALALGARVGIVEGSGGEADALLASEHWKGHPGLSRLPLDPAAIAEFLEAQPPAQAATRG
ncbi:MAG: hypothetical protein NTY38_00405, partial [Acidobacteria bacterium]|nr:hypothetical protein [Acidobacteriota bacterium]